MEYGVATTFVSPQLLLVVLNSFANIYVYNFLVYVSHSSMLAMWNRTSRPKPILAERSLYVVYTCTHFVLRAAIDNVIFLYF